MVEASESRNRSTERKSAGNSGTSSKGQGSKKAKDEKTARKDLAPRPPDLLDLSLARLGIPGVLASVVGALAILSHKQLGLGEVFAADAGFLGNCARSFELLSETIKENSPAGEAMNFRLGLLFCALAMGLGKGGVPGFSTISSASFAMIAPEGQVNRLMAFCVPITILADLFVGSLYFRDAKWSVALNIATFAAVGTGCGVVLNKYLDDDFVRRSIGAVFLLILATQEMLKKQGEKWSSILAGDAALFCVGIFGGVASYITNQMGPLLNVYMLAIALSKYELVGTRAATFILINCVKCGLRFATGDIDVEAAQEGFLLGFVAIAGVVLAKIWMKLASDRFFDILYRRVTVFVMLLMGILLVCGWDVKKLVKFVVKKANGVANS